MPKYRKMLNNLEMPEIKAMMEIIPTQSKATLANWTLNYAEKEILPLWINQYPEDTRPQAAIAAARDWLSGKIKLPAAKAQILGCHEAARENDDNPVAQASARAVAQCASTIHAVTHSLGLAFYGALAVAYDKLGINTPWPELEACAAVECGKMLASLQAASVQNEPNPCKVNWGC